MNGTQIIFCVLLVQVLEHQNRFMYLLALTLLLFREALDKAGAFIKIQHRVLIDRINRQH